MPIEPIEPIVPAAPFTAPFVLRYTYKRSLGPVLSAFFTGLRDGKLIGAKTADGRVLVPPCEYDPETGADVVGTVEVGPEGVVTSWTAVDEPDGRGVFAWALVQLDGADTAILHAVALDGAGLKTGDRVRPRWAPERTGDMADLACFERVPKTSDGGFGTPGAKTSVGSFGRSGEGPVTLLKTPTRLEYEVTAGAVTTRFLTAIMDRTLVGQRCPACTKVYIPPRGSCPTCAVPTAEAVPVGPNGTVTTYSVVRIPFDGQVLEPPYACAHVVLDGADVPLLHIIGGCDVALVRIGMRVEPVWADVLAPTLASVRYFRPVDEPDVPDDAIRAYL